MYHLIKRFLSGLAIGLMAIVLAEIVQFIAHYTDWYDWKARLSLAVWFAYLIGGKVHGEKYD